MALVVTAFRSHSLLWLIAQAIVNVNVDGQDGRV